MWRTLISHLFPMSSETPPGQTSRTTTSKPAKKKRFIPSTSNWSAQGFTNSLKELVQFETSKGRISRPIPPRQDERSIQELIMNQKNKSLILPCEVNVDGGAPQPPCWSGLELVPPVHSFGSSEGICGSSSSLSSHQTNSHTPTASHTQQTPGNGAPQPLLPHMLPKIMKRKEPAPYKGPYDDDDDDEDGSDFADDDRRYQIDLKKPVNAFDLEYYRSCPDISRIAPLVNQIAAPPPDYDRPGNDSDYYVKTKTIPRLLKKISDFSENDCKEVLVILNWDEARLKRRPYVDLGKKKKSRMNAPTAKAFLTTIIDILGRMKKTMDSPELQRIDEAVFIRDVGFDNLICVPETRQVTGRAIETSLRYHNPIFVFMNMLVDQLLAVKQALQIKCSNRKVQLLERLIQEWVFGDQPFRKRVFEEVDRVLSYIRIHAPVTPEQRVVSAQVLHRVKGGDGKISGHLTFKVMLTTLREDLHVYLLCAALPRSRLKPENSGVSDIAHNQLPDTLPQELPISPVTCPLNYPNSFELWINSTKVQEPFVVNGSEVMPIPITNYCNLQGWNTFILSFDLTEQQGRWETGMLVELVFATVRSRRLGDEMVPQYSLC